MPYVDPTPISSVELGVKPHVLIDGSYSTQWTSDPSITPGGNRPQPSILEKTSPTTKTDADGRELGLTAAGRGDPCPYVFGRTLVRPQIIAAEEHNGSLYVDFRVGVGECEAFEYILQSGEDVGLPSGWQFFLGTSGQSASSLMTTAKGTAYDALPGVCHFVGVFAPGESIDVWVMGQWLHLYDPRTTSTAYSNNPALALARIFVDSGYTVDWDTVETLADYCDEDVSGASRWTLDLPVVNRNSLRDWAHTLAQYCGGCFIDIQAGVVKFIPNSVVATSPLITHTITGDDIKNPQTRKAGSKKVPEKVVVHFQEQTGERRSATVGSGATGQISRLRLPGFSTYTMAARYATTIRNLAQADLEHRHEAFDEAILPTIGDLADITYSPHGLSAKRMRLIGVSEPEAGRWTRTYQEYDAALYSDAVFVEPSVGDTNLSNPNNPPDGPAPVVVEELYTDETGTTYSRLKVTFTGVDWPYVQGYQVVAVGEQNVLNVLIPHEGQATHTVYTAALKQGVLYTVNVKVQSITGVLSTVAGTTNATAQGKLLPPGDVPSLTAFEAGSLVSMTWDPAEEITGDLRGYIIKRIPAADYVGSSADWTHTNTVTLADRVDATTFLTAAQPSGDWYYGIKAVDNAGGYSDNATWRAVTVTEAAGVSTYSEVTTGALVNMHQYRIGGDRDYVITSTGQTWADRFGAAGTAWNANVSAGERWGGDLATDSSFESAAWDTGSLRQGNWYWTDDVTVFGGTRSNQTAIGDNSSPITYTNHSGNAVQAPGQHLKVKVFTTDSPASPGDGLHIPLPVQVSFSGAILTQSGTATIAATSPLDNPKAVVFATAYATAPEVTAVLVGSSAKIVAVDNIDATGFDVYIWDTSGALTDGVVDWQATGV